MNRYTEAAPLAVFRVLFGFMMFFSIVRFWAYGWIEKFYIEPRFFFSYYGFEFVKPLGKYTYLIFIICAASAFLVMVGYHYRLAIIVFFLSFTYIELMDKTTYLNHYYFISSLSFLLIFLPANARLSIDNLIYASTCRKTIPSWTIDSVKVLLSIVYFYAGLAKLNSDWLFHAQPLRLWLPIHYDLPMIGPFLPQLWVAYAFSWFGAVYDLSIPFLLWNKKTRSFAFVAVVVFHIATGVLFPIGMFPYIMILSTLIFFDAVFHNKLINYLSQIINFKIQNSNYTERNKTKNTLRFKLKMSVLVLFFALQFTLPFRYIFYPGELFWTEEGFRFSWRVMLIEKVGYILFKVVDEQTGKWFYVQNDDFLHPQQEKQMSTQPDFIIQFVQYLKEHFSQQGHQNIQIFADSFVSLNGRSTQRFVDHTIDLTKERDSFRAKTFILPLEDDIKGL